MVVLKYLTKEVAGARIEDKEIVIKGEDAPVEEVKAEVVETETVKPAEKEEVATVETTVETENKAE